MDGCRADSVSEKVISVSRENVNLRLVISFEDEKTPAKSLSR